MSIIEIQTKARELKELKIMKEELENEIVSIEDTLKAAMGEREELICGEYKLTYLGAHQQSGFIINRNGLPLTERQYHILWKAIQGELAKHGLHERFTAHQLRHTYATIAANSNVSPKVLQGILGHANFQTTMNTYAGLDADQMVANSRDLSAKYAEIASKSCSENCST